MEENVKPLSEIPAINRFLSYCRIRAVLEQMRSDEARHGLDAKTRGGTELPPPLPRLMRAVSRVMTRTAFWL